MRSSASRTVTTATSTWWSTRPRADDAQELLRGAGFSVIFEDAPGRCSFQDRRGASVDLCFASADRYGDRWSLNRTAGRGDHRHREPLAGALRRPGADEAAVER